MRKVKDLTGQKFGRLTVIRRVEDKICPSGTYKQYLCKCDCGNTIAVTTASLKSGHTKSCGCLRKDTLSQLTYKDLTGQVFGKLTVIKRETDYISPNGQHGTQWLCKCECGNEIIARGGNLTNENTQSCG